MRYVSSVKMPSLSSYLVHNLIWKNSLILMDGFRHVRINVFTCDILLYVSRYPILEGHASDASYNRGCRLSMLASVCTVCLHPPNS